MGSISSALQRLAVSCSDLLYIVSYCVHAYLISQISHALRRSVYCDRFCQTAVVEFSFRLQPAQQPYFPHNIGQAVYANIWRRSLGCTAAGFHPRHTMHTGCLPAGASALWADRSNSKRDYGGSLSDDGHDRYQCARIQPIHALQLDPVQPGHFLIEESQLCRMGFIHPDRCSRLLHGSFHVVSVGCSLLVDDRQHCFWRG